MFKLFKRTPKPTGQAALGQGKGGQPRPELASYIVGDLMGCASLLEGILARIDAHIGNSGATNPQLPLRMLLSLDVFLKLQIC